jgi:hypothetical protein
MNGWPCDLPLAVPLAIGAVGVAALALSVQAWKNPEAPIFRKLFPEPPKLSDVGPIERFMRSYREPTDNYQLKQVARFKMMGPLVGGVFFATGIYSTVGTVQNCSSVAFLVMPDISGPFEFVPLPLWALAWVGFVMVIGINAAWRERSIVRRIAALPGAFVVGFSSAEAATIHTGPAANQWALVDVLLVVAAVVAWGLATAWRSIRQKVTN